jgi:hypothetical protein
VKAGFGFNFREGFPGKYDKIGGMTNGLSLYLLILAGGASLATWLVIARQPPERQTRNGLLLLVVYVSAYVGARLGFVLFEMETLPQDWILLLDFQRGGLSAFGALWGGLIGFFLGCSAQRRQPYEALDQISAMVLPMTAFVCVARWTVDSALYRSYPVSMKDFLPQTSLGIANLQAPDILVLAAVLLILISWALDGLKRLKKPAGLDGNLAFTMLILFWAVLESSYGFLRLHPGFTLYLCLTAALPIISWIVWLWLGRKAEAR